MIDEIWYDMIYDMIWYDMKWYDMIYDKTWMNMAIGQNMIWKNKPRDLTLHIWTNDTPVKYTVGKDHRFYTWLYYDDIKVYLEFQY